MRPKWTSESRNLQSGDLVMLVDKDLPRGAWDLGRIITIYPGDDHRVRVVQVKTKSGTYIRPASKICLLEEN